MFDYQKRLTDDMVYERLYHIQVEIKFAETFIVRDFKIRVEQSLLRELHLRCQKLKPEDFVV